MKTKTIVKLIVGVVVPIIVALIMMLVPSKPDKKSDPIVPQKVEVRTNHGRITSITAQKVNYSEKDMIINNSNDK